MMTSFDGESMVLEPYADKWRAFNWNVVEIDGHNIAQIVDALDKLPAMTSKKPTVIIASTSKAKESLLWKGIGWHAGALSKEDMEKAMGEIDAAAAKVRSAS
jgi:transketolase